MSTAAPTYRDAADAILHGLRVPVTHPARRALGAVFIAEGRNHYWNPLNWTLPTSYPAFNSTGVREYPDFATGMHWTSYELLNNPRWTRFVASLNRPANRFGPLAEAAKVYAQWDSHPPFTQFTTLQIIARLDEEMPS